MNISVKFLAAKRMITINKKAERAGLAMVPACLDQSEEIAAQLAAPYLQRTRPSAHDSRIYYYLLYCCLF